MKSLITATLTVALAGSLFAEEAKKDATPAAPAAPAASKSAASGDLKDQDDKISYAVGVNLGGAVKGLIEEGGIAVKPEIVVKGLQDAIKGDLALEAEEIQSSLMQLQKTLQEKQVAAIQKMATENAAASTKFLEENKKKEGVKTTESGLQYEVLTEGKGKKPAVGDTVVVNYKGTLVDGTEFDATTPDSGPAEFEIGTVIPGWNEALQLMPVGSKWKLAIPSDLAYRESGMGGIGPNQALIFEVELLEIKEGKKDEKKDEKKEGAKEAK